MNKELERLAALRGVRLRVIPIERLQELEKIIDHFKEEVELNDFQKWIVNDLYRFELPKEEFKINSIVLAAIHQPFCARVTFYLEGTSKTVLSLVKADFAGTKEFLRGYMEEKGYSLDEVFNLPFKRLAVHSGLAVYGRNNITYIDGMGSNFSYAAYLTDMKCEEDFWGEVKNATACSGCSACLKACPTGAIRKETFLIDNQRCLSAMNESPREFPEWLDKSVHHTLYDCLRCQQVCPMNRDEVNSEIEEISFTEEETRMLLEGMPIDSFPEEARAKISKLGIDDCFDAIPRNLKVLLDQ